MPAEIEERISQAIVAIDIRENISRNKIAEEFRFPIRRLRSWLNGRPPASTVRGGVHGRRLALDQEKAFHNYFIQLDKIGMPARLNMIWASRQLVSSNRAQTPLSHHHKPDPFWSKRWLERQPIWFKVRRKPIAAARKNAQVPEMMMEYFET